MGFLPVLGYALYFGAVFLPGLGVGELLGLWRKSDGLSARIAIALGLGLSIDTLVILFRTSGISIFGITLLGVDLNTIYFILWIGVIALIVSLIMRRRFLFPVKPVFSDYALLGIVAIQSIMIFLYFQRYPIFPAFPSGDFHVHIYETRDMISGTISYQRGITGGPTGLGGYYYPPGGILYEGVQYQLSLAFLLVNGLDLITSQVTMGILVILGSPIFYLASEKLFKSPKAGLLTALIYAVTGMVWFGIVFDSGLDSNFFGVLAILFFVACLLIYFDSPRKPSSWILLILATLNLIMSHYSALTVLPAIAIYVLFRILSIRTKSSVLKYGLPLLLTVIGFGAILAFLPGIMLVVSSVFTAEGTAYVTGSTFLSSALSGAPFLSYLALFVSDIPFVALIVLTIVSLYFALRRREIPAFSVPLVWLLTCGLGALFSSPPNVWRFSLEALIPLNIIAGYGVYCLLERFGGKIKLRTKSFHSSIASSSLHTPSIWKVALILLITLVPLLVGSWGQMMVVNSLSNTSAAAQQQGYVYDGIIWLGNHTPNDASYLSVSDWRFTYSDVLIGRETFYDNVSNPAAALLQATNDGDQYIIVSQWIVGYNLPPPGQDPWANFPHSSSQNMTLVYTNPDVEIFSLTSS